MTNKIENIIAKFYNNEQERLLKLEKDKVFINLFIEKNHSFILDLYNSGIKLYIFHFDKEKIHAGLFPCCNHHVEITKEIRNKTEQMFESMNFTQIIWEDVL